MTDSTPYSILTILRKRKANPVKPFFDAIKSDFARVILKQTEGKPRLARFDAFLNILFSNIGS